MARPRATGQPRSVDGVRPIAIWQPRSVDGALYFVRPDPLPLGDHYSRRRAIPAEKPPGSRRVCFFGESVAAGYLFAPHLTPADYLAAYLGHLGNYDVVDLARTNETLAGLLETADAARQLQPDLLVILSGNNWPLLETPARSPYYPSAEGRRAFAASWSAHGPFGPIEAAARERLEKGAAALADLARLAGEMGARVLLVVPAVNLADWQARQPVHYLPGDGVNRWHTRHTTALATLEAPMATTEILRSRGGGALESGPGLGADKRTGLAGLAGDMQTLDGGTTPAPYYLSAWTQSDVNEATRLLAAAANAAQFATHCFLPAPRATAMDQELLRRAAAAHGFAVVDLPAVFAAHTGNPAFGRRLFLDYCHFTAEGTAVAMAAVAATAHATLNPGIAALEIGPILKTGPICKSPILALARFGAAVHTAHRHLPLGPHDPLILYWLNAALDADPGVATAMVDLVHARLAPGPAVFTTAQQRNLASPYPLTLQHGWRYDHRDLPLLDAIYNALASRDAAAATSVAEAFAATVAPTTNLLFSNLWEPLARPVDEALPAADITPRAFYRAFWPRTTLGFVAGGASTLSIRLTARLPGRRAQLALQLNGRLLATLPVTDQWSTHALTLPAAAHQPGINRLTVGWPPLEDAGPDPMAPILKRLAAGHPAPIHPHFGDLWEVIVIQP